MTLQYKGTHYLGFQVQSEGKTIQGELNRALKTLSNGAEIKSIGSGRTDSGVHALGQVVRIEIPVAIPVESLARAINTHLPLDIRVTEAFSCSEHFHPIFSAKSKEYNYLFSTRPILSPFAQELVTTFPYDLDIAAMKQGAKYFIGKHDFINYQCTGTDVETTVREIFDCEIIHCNSNGHLSEIVEGYYLLRIVGNGFLKQMVRLIMGALWSLGRGKITQQDLINSLSLPQKSRLGATAPPQGLYLKEVHY